jgi:hypothetical protein
MRALRKEPQHRYNSIEQFASDIRRYLSREPVQARQGNWVYYSQRFIRRHAFGVTAGAAFIVFIIAFAVAMSIQTQRIAAERDRVYQESETAKVVSAFMEEIFDKSQPLRNLGQTVTARDLLDEAGRRIRGDLNQRPEGACAAAGSRRPRVSAARRVQHGSALSRGLAATAAATAGS